MLFMVKTSFKTKESYNFWYSFDKVILHKCKKVKQRLRFIRMFLFKVEKIAAFYVKTIIQVSETWTETKTTIINSSDFAYLCV